MLDVVTNFSFEGIASCFFRIHMVLIFALVDLCGLRI